MYRCADAALVRAAAYPSTLTVPPAPGSLDAHAPVDAWRAWITQVWTRAFVAEAVELASPVLARRIEAICAGEQHKPKVVRRVAAALYRYLLRLHHRATPFGLFAGIAPARLGEHVSLRWGEKHRPAARVDASWLATVIARLEACPELLLRLPVVADSTCFVRGDRLVVPCPQPPPGAQYAPGEVSVRHTPAVQRVVAAAASPISADNLADTLAIDYPTMPTTAIEALLAELVARGVLLSSLRAPMTASDPLQHLVQQLDAVGAENIPTAAPHARVLHQVQATLADHDDAPPAQRQALRTELAEQMRTHCSTLDQPLACDLRLDCQLTLPTAVAREAEQAAGTLVRLSPYPSGTPAWQDYHARFLERYGPGAVVPVLQLADPDAGLDLPAGYRGSLLQRPGVGLTRRDEYLLAVAQRAACEGAREVTVSDAMIAQLEPAASTRPPAHIDLRFVLHAASSAALDCGDFTLAVTGLAPAAGATAGRFLSVLDPDERERMTATYAGLPSLTDDAVPTQLSSPPLHKRTENVGRTPQVWPTVVSIGEHRCDRTLRLDDVAVTADASRMYLIALSTGQIIEPAALNTVDFATFTHPLARLLCELPRARTIAVGPFTWGAAAGLPFVPRMRYRRSILAPATWRIAASDLAPPTAPLPRWQHSLKQWRERFGVPETVDLGEDDQRLRLRLDQAADAHLLRVELNRAGHAVLREALDPAMNGWFGRPHEITVALASTHPPRKPNGHGRPDRRRALARDHGHVPGASPWASLRLYCHPQRMPEILTHHLTTLLAGWSEPPTWWFLRYRDHVRLRFHLPHPGAFAALTDRVGTWAVDLRRCGLAGEMQWDTYYPETGRYGTEAAMDAAERVFAADSAAALAQLRLTLNGEAHPHALAAASLVDLAIGLSGDVVTGMQWLVDHITPNPLAHPTRRMHDAAMRLVDPDGDLKVVRDLPGGDQVSAAWTNRRHALEVYRAQLTSDDGPQPQTVLPSLLHTHHLRALGIDEDSEHLCHRLARSAAVAFTARDEQSHRGSPA